MAGSVTRRQRFTREHRCPICGGFEEAERHRGIRCSGFVGADGKYAHCSREEKAGGISMHSKTQAFPHLLRGDCRCGVRHGEPEDRPKAKGRIVAEYDYIDEGGVRLYQVVRLDPKAFRQRRENAAGAWTWKIGDVRRIVYRLPELREADPAAPVFVVEGEKDVESLRGLGLVATCNPGGAGKWRADYSQHLAGRAVVIVPDRDAPGRAHAQEVAAACHGVAASVRVLEMPEPAKDVSAWLEAGGNADALQALASAVAEWTPPAFNRFKQRALERRAEWLKRGDRPGGFYLEFALADGTEWRSPVPGTEDMHQVDRAIVEFVRKARIHDPRHPWGKAKVDQLAATLGVERKTIMRRRRRLEAQGWIVVTSQFERKGLWVYQHEAAHEAGPLLLAAEDTEAAMHRALESHPNPEDRALESHAEAPADDHADGADREHSPTDGTLHDGTLAVVSPGGARPPEVALPVVSGSVREGIERLEKRARAAAPKPSGAGTGKDSPDRRHVVRALADLDLWGELGLQATPLRHNGLVRVRFRCPLHQDSIATATLHEHGLEWRCDDCHRGLGHGDALDLIAAARGCAPEAVLEEAQRIAAVLQARPVEVKPARPPRPPTRPQLTRDERKVLLRIRSLPGGRVSTKDAVSLLRAWPARRRKVLLPRLELAGAVRFDPSPDWRGGRRTGEWVAVPDFTA